MNFVTFGILLVSACAIASSLALDESVSNKRCELNYDYKIVLGNVLNVTQNVEQVGGQLDHCEVFKALLKATKEVRPLITTNRAMANVLLGLISKTDTIPQNSMCQLLRTIPGLQNFLIVTINSSAFAEVRVTIKKILDTETSEMEKEKLNCQLLDQTSKLFQSFDINFLQNVLGGVTNFVNKLVVDVLGTLGLILG